MTASPTDALVQPVPDCEPPAVGGPPVPPPVAQAPPRCADPVRPPSRGPAEQAHTRAAAVFADAALRRVLEVIDRRRPPAQLRALLAAGLADSLPPAGPGGPARLRRVIAQLSDPRGVTAEVAGSYTRGTRLHAIACRVERTPGPAGPQWQVVALHLG